MDMHYYSSSSDEDDLLLLAAVIDDKEQQRRKRRKWVHDINAQRESLGEFNHLMPQLLKDPKRFFIYFRMSSNCFDEILNLIDDNIRKETTHFRVPIPPPERLAIALRFFATGDSCKTIGHSYRVGSTTVGQIVIEGLALPRDQTPGFKIYNNVKIIESDDDFTIKLQAADGSENLNVFYFISESADNADDYEPAIYKLKTMEKVQVFKVDVGSKCETTGRDFDVQTRPTVMLRKFGINIHTFEKPMWVDLNAKINEHLNTKREIQNKIQEFKNDEQCNGVKPALAADDRRDKMMVIWIHHNNDGDQNSDLETKLQELKGNKEYNFTVFKINSTICAELDKEYEHRVDIVKSTFPRILIRKFGHDRHKLFGYSSEEFNKIFMDNINKMQEEFNGQLFEVTLLQYNKFKCNAVRYADNDQDVNSLVSAAESANKLIVLGIFECNSIRTGDYLLDQLALDFKTIMVIKVETKECTKVLREYADKAKKEDMIHVFPTFIVRAFREIKGRTILFLEDQNIIRNAIRKYKDKKTDPDLDQPKSYAEQLNDVVHSGVLLLYRFMASWRR